MKLVRGITIPANPDAPAVLRTIRQSHLPDYQRWVGGHLKALALTKPLGILYMEYSSSGAFNGRATSLVRKHRELPGNEVRGDVLLFGSIDAYGNDVDVNEDYIAELRPQSERYRVEIRFAESPIWAKTAKEYDSHEEALRIASYMANHGDMWRIVPTDTPALQNYVEGSEDGTGPREKDVWINDVTAIVLPADISREPSLRSLQKSNLEDYQAFVAGPIEAVNIYDPPATVYLNENGMYLGLPLNPRAEALVERHRTGFLMHNAIRGDVILIGPPDEEANDLSVPREYAHELGLLRD